MLESYGRVALRITPDLARLTFLDGRNARNAEQMRGEFGDAVSRQGSEADELIAAIMGYGERKAASAQQAIPHQDLIRAIMGGGALAAAGQVP